MRKIKVFTPALEKQWAQRLKDEASQFLTHHSLRVTDIGRTFSDKKGKWLIIGACQQKEIACKNLETNEIFSRSSWEISKILYPERHAMWDELDKNKKTSKDSADTQEMKDEFVVDDKELEAALEEEIEAELDFSRKDREKEVMDEEESEAFTLTDDEEETE
jgi:hypothetical protein